MNPSVGEWNNLPPSGTDASHEGEDEHSPAGSTLFQVRNAQTEDAPHRIRSIDRLDPFLKSPEYIEYEKQIQSRDRSYHRRRSRSKSKYSEKEKQDKKHRSRSRSYDNYRRSRSRDRHYHRHHKYRSRSRSSTNTKRDKSKRSRRYKRSSSRSYHRSISCSRSRSRSRSHKSSRSHRHHRRRYSRDRYRDLVHSGSEERNNSLNTSGEVEEDEEPPKENAFKNDGSFLEMFKKMQEEQQKAAENAVEQAGTNEIGKPIPTFGKRRGGRILKTGLVRKTKVTEEVVQSDASDAWSVYMKEVKRYKEACCDDDSKTRPLVK